MAILKLSTGYNRLFPMFQSAAPQTPLVGATVSVSLSKNGGAFAAAAGAVTGIGLGIYQVALSTTDCNTLGDLAYSCTASGGNPTLFVDQVVSHFWNDIALDGNGNVSTTSNIKQNQPVPGFMFIMTNNVNHAPQPGLTVLAQRSLGGAGFAPCANPVTELSNGVYQITLASTDTNSQCLMLRFTASGADDLDILLMTQP